MKYNISQGKIGFVKAANRGGASGAILEQFWKRFWRNFEFFDGVICMVLLTGVLGKVYGLIPLLF